MYAYFTILTVDVRVRFEDLTLWDLWRTMNTQLPGVSPVSVNPPMPHTYQFTYDRCCTSNLETDSVVTLNAIEKGTTKLVQITPNK